MKKSLLTLTVLFFALSGASFAQFGAGPGDLVLYAVTYNGGGELQPLPPGAGNSAANLASFNVVSLDSVPTVLSDPFPLERKVFYMTDSETFQVGTDFETTVGLHRIFTATTKILQFEGMTNAVGSLVGGPPTFLSFPKDLDVEGDIALLTLRVITWFPKAWPFIALTDHRGTVGPPDIPGFLYLFTSPGLVKIPSLMTWSNLSALYPGGGWPSGADLKMLDQDPQIGDTIRLIRLHPGKTTPVFRTAGHTHLFVLNGTANITPAGGSAATMNQHDYAFLPENFAVSIANPAQYAGPGAP